MARPRNTWSLAVGARGHKVTVYERTPGGPLWLRWWVPSTSTTSGAWQYRALKHADRSVAEQTAKEVAAQLLASTLATARGRATVAEVLAIYEHDVAAHLKGDGPREAERRIAIWTAFLGGGRDVQSVDFPTLERFVRARRSGVLTVDGYELAKAPSDRAIAADLVLLQAALNHATRVMRANGTRLLEANPVRGFPAPRNRNVRRPVATYDRFLKVMEHADAVDPQKLFGAFMQLVEGLGWRVSAICALRACDVDRRAIPAAPLGRIFKNPERDKEGVGGWLPMSESVRAGVDRVLTVNPALGEWPLFPAKRAKVTVAAGEIPKVWSRYHARSLLGRAEGKAKLEPLEGSDFHAYRRAWASARKHLPAQDVARVGGWKDLRTLQTAYQQDDEATTLAVVNEPRKLRELKASDGEAKTG